MFAVQTRTVCHKTLPAIRKIFKELYKKGHLKFTGICQYEAIPGKRSIQNFDQIKAMYACFLSKPSRCVTIFQYITFPSHTTSLYYHNTFTCYNFWQHVSVALLQPSSGQYYIVCAFHARTLWDPILCTDNY
jgi:hypothetical protein